MSDLPNPAEVGRSGTDDFIDLGEVSVETSGAGTGAPEGVALINSLD